MAMENMDGKVEDDTRIGEENDYARQAEVVPSPQPRAVHALSQGQERKLVDYLEDRFLDITRNFKKRFAFNALEWFLMTSD